jgi:hypothetical protein
MNQNLRTTDEPEFEGLTLTESGLSVTGPLTLESLSNDDTEMLVVDGYGSVSSMPLPSGGSFDQDLNTTDDPEFASLTITDTGLSVTGPLTLESLSNEETEMLVVDGYGSVSSMPLPSGGSGSTVRSIFVQTGDHALEDDDSEITVIPSASAASSGSNVIPASHWEIGAYAEIRFEFEAHNDQDYAEQVTFKPMLNSVGLGEFSFPMMSEEGATHGRGSIFLVYKEGALTTATLRAWMEVGGDAEGAVVAPGHSAPAITTSVNLSSNQNVSVIAQLVADSPEGLGIIIMNARVIWHPAPQGLG